MDELFFLLPFCVAGMRTRNNERRGDYRGEKSKAMKLPEEAQEKMILRATNGLRSSMPQRWISAKWGKMAYRKPGKLHPVVLFGCPRNFRTLKFSEFVGQLADANLLFKVVQYSLKQIYTQSTLPTTIWGWF